MNNQNINKISSMTPATESISQIVDDINVMWEQTKQNQTELHEKMTELQEAIKKLQQTLDVKWDTNP